MQKHILILVAAIATVFLVSACVEEPSTGLYDPCTGERVGSIDLETGESDMAVATNSAVVADSSEEAMAAGVDCVETQDAALDIRPEQLPRTDLRGIDYWQRLDVEPMVDDDRLEVIRSNVGGGR